MAVHESLPGPSLPLLLCSNVAAILHAAEVGDPGRRL
jgi:hypothetical protein